MGNTNKDNITYEDALGLMLPKDDAQAISLITNAYLSQIDSDIPPEPEEIADSILGLIEIEFLAFNKNAEAGTKRKIPRGLPWYAIADIMLHLHKIKNINCSGVNSEREYDILGIYQEWGENEGIYISDETVIRNLMARYNKALGLTETKQVMNRLKDRAERVERCSDPDLIAVNNGIFNYKTKIVEPFDPDKIFTAKSHVDYNPTAKNVVIHNNDDGTDWNIDTWIDDLFDDPEIPELIWQILGAVIRSNVKWNKCLLFYSPTGNNGKGSTCQLLRNITGAGTHVSIPMDKLGEDFMLEQLISATSIITDENDVGIYLEKVANLKAIITNDVIQINRKHKTAINYQFKGIMVQCINELPAVRDKSESLYRRILLIPFDKCYTGVERRYIKDDYLNRREVLEYVLYKVLNMDYYTLKEPDSCKSALQEYRVYNDPVRDFLDEILPDTTWDYLTNQLIYDVYCSWMRRNNPNGTVLGKQKLLREVRNIVGSGMHGWVYPSSGRNVPATAAICNDDSVLTEYSIYNYKKYDKNGKTTRGLFRESAIP